MDVKTKLGILLQRGHLAVANSDAIYGMAHHRKNEISSIMPMRLRASIGFKANRDNDSHEPSKVERQRKGSRAGDSVTTCKEKTTPISSDEK